MEKRDEKLTNRNKNLEVAASIYQLVYETRFYRLSLKFPDLSKEELHKLVLGDIEKACSK